MAEPTMRVVLVLWVSAAVMATAALLFWTGTIDLGMDPTMLALIAALIAVADLGLSAVLLARRRP